MEGKAQSAPRQTAPAEWLHARLIPTAGIRSEMERERRASSCLLAVLHGVPEFGHALLHKLGAPKSPTIDTYAEVRFKDGSGKTVIPDGAIVCQWGKRRWTCLVEVKTGANALKVDQVASYLDLARDNDFDGVLTISNQITAGPAESPIEIDGRKLRKASLWHLSWWGILTEAVVQSRRGISDSNQAWILRELIHYLGNEASGATAFEDMGEHWVAVRKGAREQTLRAGSAQVGAVADRWEQFTQYLCLSLSQSLGRGVSSPRPRKQTTAGRLEEIAKCLVASGVLVSSLRIPDAVGDVELRADLRARQTMTAVSLDAPQDRGARPRVTWLIRQLEGAPDEIRVEAAYPNVRDTVAATLAEVRQDPARLLHATDAKRGAKNFIVTLSKPMGQKRGRTEGSFVRETSAQTVTFYRDLVQNLKAWQPAAPRVQPESDPATPGAEDLPVEPVWSEEETTPDDGDQAERDTQVSPAR